MKSSNGLALLNPLAQLPEEVMQFFEQIEPWILKFTAEFHKQASRVDPNAMQNDIVAAYHVKKFGDFHKLPFENLLYAHTLLQTFRVLFPEKTVFITFPSTASEKQVAMGVHRFFNSFDWLHWWNEINRLVKKYWPQWSKFLESFKNTFFDRPWLNDIPDSVFERQRQLKKLLKNKSLQSDLRIKLERELMSIQKMIRDKAAPYFEEDKLLSKQFEARLVAFKKIEHDRNFVSTEEAREFESRIRLYKEIDRLVHHKSIHYILEQLSRDYLWDPFVRGIMDEIEEEKPAAATQILDKMIGDFISPNPDGLWRDQAAKNFHHDIDHELLLQNFSRQSKVKFIADQIVKIMDQLVDDIRTLFITNIHRDTFEITQDFDDLTPAQQSLRLSIIVHFQCNLLDNFIKKNPGHPLAEEIKRRREIWLDSGRRDSVRNMLRDIYVYPFTIEQRIYDEQDVTAAIYRQSFKYRAIQKLILRNSLNKAIRDDILRELQPLLRFVEQLFQTRKKDLDEFKPVFCMGFSGRKFNPNAVKTEQNAVYLAFSKSAASSEHMLFLRLLRDAIRNPKHWSNDPRSQLPFEVHALPEDIRRIEKNKHVHAKYNNPDHNQKVFQYVLKNAMRRVFLFPDTVHDAIKQAWIKAVGEILLERKSNFKIDQLPLTRERYDELERIVLAHQKFSCAESLVSRYGHTNIYIPITLRHEHKSQFSIAGKPIFVGGRVTIPPCCNCQVLSAAYMLWSSITRGWNVNELEEIAQRNSQPSVPIRWFAQDQTARVLPPTVTPVYTDSIQTIKENLQQHLDYLVQCDDDEWRIACIRYIQILRDIVINQSAGFAGPCFIPNLIELNPLFNYIQKHGSSLRDCSLMHIRETLAVLFHAIAEDHVFNHALRPIQRLSYFLIWKPVVYQLIKYFDWDKKLVRMMIENSMPTIASVDLKNSTLSMAYQCYKLWRDIDEIIPISFAGNLFSPSRSRMNLFRMPNASARQAGAVMDHDLRFKCVSRK